MDTGRRAVGRGSPMMTSPPVRSPLLDRVSSFLSSAPPASDAPPGSSVPNSSAAGSTSGSPYVEMRLSIAELAQLPAVLAGDDSQVAFVKAANDAGGVDSDGSSSSSDSSDSTSDDSDGSDGSDHDAGNGAQRSTGGENGTSTSDSAIAGANEVAGAEVETVHLAKRARKHRRRRHKGRTVQVDAFGAVLPDAAHTRDPALAAMAALMSPHEDAAGGAGGAGSSGHSGGGDGAAAAGARAAGASVQAPLITECDTGSDSEDDNGDTAANAV